MSLLNNLLIDQKKCWFTLKEWEGLFYFDLETGACDCLEDTIVKNTSRNIDTSIKRSNFIFLLPTGKYDVIDVFDIVRKKYIHHIRLNINGNCYFDNAVVRGKYIYLINNWSDNPAIYILNTNKMKICRKIVIDKDLLWKSKKSGRLFSKDIVVNKNILILASAASQYIVRVNLEDYTVEYLNISCNLKGFATMCTNKDEYWLTDEDGLVLRWSMKDAEEFDLKNVVDLNVDLSKEELEYKENSQGYRASYMYFNSTIYLGGKIFWIPGRANILLELDILSKKWSTVCERPKISGYTTWLLYPNLTNEKLYFFSVREQKLFDIANAISENRFEPTIKNKNIFIEDDLLSENRNSLINLDNYINNYISFKGENYRRRNETRGRNIWNLIIS